MKKHLLFRDVLQLFTLALIFTAFSFAQVVPGGDAPPISSGKHFVHIATAGNSTANYTSIDNPNTNANPTAKLFIAHNYDASGSGVYNNHVSGLWYNSGTSKWTIFNEDSGGVPIIQNSAYHILVADETQSTVFQHTARPSNTVLNWTVLSNPATDGKPNARILVTQILIDTAGNVYNNREIGVWYNGSKWAIFNQNQQAMINGASFNVLVLTEDNSILHTATSGNIQSSTTKIDHPDLNNNPNAIIYVTQNFGVAGGVFNTSKVSTYYYSGKWSIYNEDFASMVNGSKYNVYFGSPTFVHKTLSSNLSGDLTKFDNPLVNQDPNAFVFTLHNWNPYGTGTLVHNKKIGVFHNGSVWGIYNEDNTNLPENLYLNVAIAPKTDSAFLHTTTASNISGGNYTTIDNPLLNGNSQARILVQHIYKGSRHDVNLGVWYDGSKWTIFTEDNSVMPAGKDYNVWLLPSDKSFVHTVDSSNIYLSSNSLLDNPQTNNNPNANILVTALLNGGDYFDHVQGTYYDITNQKWAIYNEDLTPYSVGIKYNIYVANSLGLPTAVEEENNPAAIINFDLQQNYPNPFNPTTQIRFSLAEQSQVTLKVYNILGKEIATLVNDVKGAGVHEVSFNGAGLASGVYFYTLQAGKFTQTHKMILMK
jgi:Secretion system C-terminal sorting domain